MDRYDTAKFAPGMVYELSKVNDFDYAGSFNEESYMIISSVRSNSKLDTVMVAPVIEFDDYNGYGVQFVTRRGGRNVVNTVCVDRMFKAAQKRLCKYRYTVSKEVISEIGTTIQEMFFGEPLFTKDQALTVAYKEELMLRVGNMQNIQQNASQPEIPEDPYVPEDFKPVSKAEEEAIFARKMMANPIPDPIVTIKSVYEAEEEGLIEPEPAVKKLQEKNVKTKAAKVKAIEKEKPKHIVISKGKVTSEEEMKPSTNRPKYVPAKRLSGYGMYKDIYDHWEDFLPDYATLPSEELLSKYNLPDIGTVYRLGKECKKIAKANGVDTSVFRKKVDMNKEVANV